MNGLKLVFEMTNACNIFSENNYTEKYDTKPTSYFVIEKVFKM